MGMNDDTLTLDEAAKFCGVSKREMARSGIGTKKTKSWRFIRSDLLEYLRPSYPTQRRALSSEQERKQCHTKEKVVGSGGSLLEDYAKALGQTTSKRQRHSRTS